MIVAIYCTAQYSIAPAVVIEYITAEDTGCVPYMQPGVHGPDHEQEWWAVRGSTDRSWRDSPFDPKVRL